jgi:NAD(P)-dependent dehydrogenase (short-subunit alcohol dehydrogenase family)
LAAELPGSRFASAVGDVTDREALGKAVMQLREKLGPVDIVVPNAGIGLENPAVPFSAADFEAQIRVNLLGVANTVEAVLPEMLERKRGQIVGISSLASYRGLPHMLGYCASKSAVNALMEGMRVELKPHGINVTIICPGWIRTPLAGMVPYCHRRSPPPRLLRLSREYHQPGAAAQMAAQRRQRLADPAGGT